MKKVLSIIGIFWALTNAGLYAQNNFYFNTYGSTSGDEEMEAVIGTRDSGLLIAGASNSFSTGGDEDLLMLKTDSLGNLQWAKVYGGAASDMATDVRETSDGGLIVVGWTQSFGAAGYDFWVLKTDNMGNVQWQNRYGGNGNDQAWSVAVDNNAYFVVGGTDSYGAGLTDLWALKLDLNGNIIWQKTYGSAGDDAPPGLYAEYVAKGLIDQNGNYLIAGMTDGIGHGATDIYLAKLDPANGNIIWQYAYGDVDEESFWAFTASPTGGYYLPGNRVDPVTFEADLWVVYVDTTGAIQWQKTFGIPGKWDEALNATALSDGSVILAAYFEDNAANWTASALKADKNGNFLWANQYKAGDLDWTNAVSPMPDNSLVFVGVTTNTSTWDEDLTLFRTNSDGAILGCNVISALNLTVAGTNTTRQSINLTVTATTVSPVGTSSTPANVSVTNTGTCAVVLATEKPTPEANDILIYPNPTKGAIEVRFAARQTEVTGVVKNNLGQVISRKVWRYTDAVTLRINAPMGVYILELVNGKGEKTIVKIIKN